MMRRSVKLEDLPVYALEPLGKYLTVSDLNSCCSVSKPWHTIFSQNHFWKRHCNVIIVDYLKSHPSEVGNTSTVLAEDPHISLMSEWRANFVYQNQLRDNWINMRCNIEEIEFPELSTSNHVHFHNDYIFIKHYQYVDVWKIANVPIHITKITFETANKAIDLSPEYDTASWLPSNERFVIVFSNLVRVYDISKVQDDCPVSFSFLFDKTEEESLIATQTQSLPNLVHKTEKQTRFSVIGDIFIGISYCLMRMHIWNIVTKKKIKVEELSMLIDQNVVLERVECLEITSDNIVIQFVSKLYWGDTPFYHCVYNIKKLQFLPLKVFSSDCFYLDISNQYLYLTTTDENRFVLRVYDFNHESKVVRKYLLQTHGLELLVGNNMISFGNEGCMVLNISSGKSDLFEVPFPYEPHALWDNFAAFHSTVYFLRATQLCMMIWYVGKGKRMFGHPSEYKSLSRSFTKLYSVYGNKVYVFSFW